MALVNYLSGSELDTVNTLWGTALNLSASGLFSIYNWIVTFVTTNFTIILVIVALVIFGTMVIRKLKNYMHGKSAKSV